MFNQSIESQQTAGKHKAGKQLSHHLILAAQQHDTPQRSVGSGGLKQVQSTSARGEHGREPLESPSQ